MKMSAPVRETFATLPPETVDEGLFLLDKAKNRYKKKHEELLPSKTLSFNESASNLQKRLIANGLSGTEAFGKTRTLVDQYCVAPTKSPNEAIKQQRQEIELLFKKLHDNIAGPDTLKTLVQFRHRLFDFEGNLICNFSMPNTLVFKLERAVKDKGLTPSYYEQIAAYLNEKLVDYETFINENNSNWNRDKKGVIHRAKDILRLLHSIRGICEPVIDEFYSHEVSAAKNLMKEVYNVLRGLINKLTCYSIENLSPIPKNNDEEKQKKGEITKSKSWPLNKIYAEFIQETKIDVLQKMYQPKDIQECYDLIVPAVKADFKRHYGKKAALEAGKKMTSSASLSSLTEEESKYLISLACLDASVKKFRQEYDPVAPEYCPTNSTTPIRETLETPAKGEFQTQRNKHQPVDHLRRWSPKWFLLGLIYTVTFGVLYWLDKANGSNRNVPEHALDQEAEISPAKPLKPKHKRMPIKNHFQTYCREKGVGLFPKMVSEHLTHLPKQNKTTAPGA